MKFIAKSQPSYTDKQIVSSNREARIFLSRILAMLIPKVRAICMLQCQLFPMVWKRVSRFPISRNNDVGHWRLSVTETQLSFHPIVCRISPPPSPSSSSTRNSAEIGSLVSEYKCLPKGLISAHLRHNRSHGNKGLDCNLTSVLTLSQRG